MYVTRPLSQYLKFPNSLSVPPPEGPTSGILVIQDEESEATSCSGLHIDPEIMALPIPQTKNISILDTSDGTNLFYTDVMLIPVLTQPPSSNQYYAIHANSGEAYTSSKEEDMVTCCFCNYIRDVKTRPLDPHDIYQQFKIYCCGQTCNNIHGFYAKSIASDGFPPYFLRKTGWKIGTRIIPKKNELGEASGIDTALRAHLPDFNFPLARKSYETVVVGKWYCPFMFIKEGTLKNQIKRSPYYEMTLEQRWEQIFVSKSRSSKTNVVKVDAVVQREDVFVAGREAEHGEEKVIDGVLWFQDSNNAGGEISVGLSLAIVERMRWEQERVGWIDGGDRQVNVKRREEFRGVGEWRKFGCYILVERFVLRRMDRSLVLTYDFKHSHQINSKWE